MYTTRQGSRVSYLAHTSFAAFFLVTGCSSSVGPPNAEKEQLSRQTSPSGRLDTGWTQVAVERLMLVRRHLIEYILRAGHQKMIVNFPCSNVRNCEFLRPSERTQGHRIQPELGCRKASSM